MNNKLETESIYKDFIAKIEEAKQLVFQINFSDRSIMKEIGETLYVLVNELKHAAAKDLYQDLQPSYTDTVTLDEFFNKIDEVMAPQEIQFLIDCLPHIQDFLFENVPKWQELSLLDVGPRFGYGAKLMESLYKGASLGYKIKVDAIDLFDLWANFTYLCCPEVNFNIGDISNIDGGKRWDIVYCSGVIEHVENTDEFLTKLLRITGRVLFVLAPYNEDPITIPSHLHTITEKTFAQHKPYKINIFKSSVWRPHDRKNYKMILAIFKNPQ